MDRQELIELFPLPDLHSLAQGGRFFPLLVELASFIFLCWCCSKLKLRGYEENSEEPSSYSGQDLVGFPQGAESWDLGWASPTSITPPHQLHLPGHTQKTYMNKVELCPAKPSPTDCLSQLKCRKAAPGCGACGPNPLYQVSKAFQDIHDWVCAAQTPWWLCLEM